MQIRFEKGAKWNAGDKVKVVFPNVLPDKLPVGILMTDEFVDENGEHKGIFCPLVDGALGKIWRLSFHQNLSTNCNFFLEIIRDYLN